MILAAQAGAAEPARDALSWNGATTSVATEPLGDGRRRYMFHHAEATGAARDRVVEELAGESRLRSASPLFDGLYALALTELAEDRVDEIQDGQFNDGHPIPCRCFQTGAKWPYVWTRDISFSVDLALAGLEPARARESLFFKQSGLRGTRAVDAGATRLVAQDTGSGGSWPVSTDRVVWIHAASDVVDALGADGEQLRGEVLRIALDTLAQDRRHAFDAASGLYRGETSFLDWREQTYPAWTRDDTRFIAEGFALSTNVLHYVALRDAARLARGLHRAQAPRLEAEAAALKIAINSRFWVPSEGLYASYLSRDLAPLHAFDLLGLSLAIIHGVADAQRAESVLSRYPVTSAGPPVIWPEQPEIAIYHNRALWPFVTAYALRAAAAVRNASLMSAYAQSLVRGTAMSLSNYENQEFLTQEVHFEDGPLSGPVINSPRQLWSVAGYLGFVVHDLVGLHIGDGGMLRITPSLPGQFARSLVAPGGRIVLQQLALPGRHLDVELEAPASWEDDDLLEAGDIVVDGRHLSLREELPTSAQHVSITLRAKKGASTLTFVTGANHPHALNEDERRVLFAPSSPTLSIVNGSARAGNVAPANPWTLLRDGREVGTASADAALPVKADPVYTHCYMAVQAWPNGGHRSLPSRETCVGGSERRYDARSLSSKDGLGPELADGKPMYRAWGLPEQRLHFTDVAAGDGLQRLRIHYSNGYGPVNTGITAGVKVVTAHCPSAGREQHGTVVMPHLANAEVEDVSTAFTYRARRGERCEIEVSDGENMSYLEHFTLYTAGRGGRSGPWNRADIRGASVASIADPPARGQRPGSR